MHISSFITGLSIVATTSLWADPTISLSSQIESAINKALPHANVSILVKDAHNGQIYFRKNADKLLSPASNIKLFTAAAAFYYWQPDHLFKTSLQQYKNNYYLSFGGSPSLTANNLADLVTHYFLDHKIKQINGDIVLDTSLFTPPYYPSGTSYDDMGWYYAAPVTALILNENSASYELSTNKELGKLVHLSPKKNGDALTVINNVVTTTKEDAKAHCSLNVSLLANNTVRLYGCVAQSKNPKLLELAVTDPEYWAKQIIRSSLKQKGITFNGSITNGTTPKDAITLITLHSAPLSKLIKHMLQESDNLYADNLTKQLAVALTKEGTNKQAMFALKQILAKHTSLDMTQLDLADGIGTRYNLATTEQIGILLSAIYKNKSLFDLFITSLPQSGVSGTLKDRMKKTPLEKIVYAKTGSMHDISALSGYLINPNGKALIFSIIINGVNKPANKAKGLEEEILTIIDKEINGDSPQHSDFG